MCSDFCLEFCKWYIRKVKNFEIRYNCLNTIAKIKNSEIVIKDIKNASVLIAIESVEKLLQNSIDKSKLDKIFNASIEETKLALKKKSS